MKKLLIVLVGAGLGVVMFIAAIICLVYLTSSNTVSIDVRNDCKAILHNVALILPGLPDAEMHEMLPGQSFGSGRPSRMKLAFRVVFDVPGRHYDIPAQIHLLPFGSYYVLITIDERMQVSIKASMFMGA